MNKKLFTEQDIRSKFIGPAIHAAGWNALRQIREEVQLTKGKVLVQGKLATRGKGKRADYVLYHKPNLPIAVVEAKDNNHAVGTGMQQALGYAHLLDVPFAFSSNGDGFLFHDATGLGGQVEQELGMNEFPSPEVLWQRYRTWKGFDAERERVVTQEYYADGSGKEPRYYQRVAINRSVEAVSRGQNRVLLVMATGTGKTYTAFQIIWRLWKAGIKKRILFLADRNILVDQTKTNDFKPFGSAMTKITNRTIDKSYEIYLSLYQAVTGTEEERNIYKQFSRDFFDLVVVDECHRGSAAEDSAWREILDYFSSATHLGLTATPKETEKVSNIHYFGEPVYTYSLRQGIEDGFLAPYKVVRVDMDRDLAGWRPEAGQKDKHGEEIEDRIYNQRDFDRTLVLEERTNLVARKVSEFLKGTDRFAKTIVFCENVDHAERMRQALVNENADLAAEDRRYVMRITGDDVEGKMQLDNFIDPESRYPVIATTSELMTTGVDAQTCKLIVLDQTIRRGKLVPQDPSDEPASVLLERIAAERQRLCKEGWIGKPKLLPPIGEAETLFEAPDGWVWVRFGQTIELISGQHLVPTEYNDQGDGLPYLTGPADFGVVSPIASRWTHERRAVARKGDVLLTVKGAGIGKTNVLECEEAAISRQLMAIRPLVLERRFANLLARSATEQFRAKQVGIAIPGIGRDDVLQLKVALPPLPEQRRIMERVDELMALCDRLEARLTAAREKSTHLAASVVHHLAAA